jgi:hypothetical protein
MRRPEMYRMIKDNRCVLYHTLRIQQTLVILICLLLTAIWGCEALKNMQVRQAPDGSLQFHSASVPESKDEAFDLLPWEQGMSVIRDFMGRNGWEEDTFEAGEFRKGGDRCVLYYREKPDGTDIATVGKGDGTPAEYYIPAGTGDDIETCLKQLGLGPEE